jgi:hypothetical protein
MRAGDFGGHASALAREEQCEQVKERQLRGEAFGGRHGLLDAREGKQGGAGLARDGCLRHVRDGHRLRAAIQGLALRRDGVGGLSRLRDDDDNRIGARVRRAVAILARIFHVHGDAGQILHHDFAGQPGVAAGPAGGNDDFLEREERVLNGLQRGGKNDVALDVFADRFPDGVRLLVDLARHGMSKQAPGRAFRGLGFAGHQQSHRFGKLFERDIMELSSHIASANSMRFLAPGTHLHRKFKRAKIAEDCSSTPGEFGAGDAGAFHSRNLWNLRRRYRLKVRTWPSQG